MEDQFDHCGETTTDTYSDISSKDFKEENIQELMDNDVPVEKENVEPVGAEISTSSKERSFEDKFMAEVRNLGSVKERKAPQRYGNEICNLANQLTSESDEPKTLTEAMKNKGSGH